MRIDISWVRVMVVVRVRVAVRVRAVVRVRVSVMISVRFLSPHILCNIV